MSRRPARRLRAAAALLCASLAGTGCDGLLSSGSFGSGTPPPTRDRGSVIATVEHGGFAIEVRRYRAGKDGHDSPFCDYRVSFGGKPLEGVPDLDHYNGCGALLLLEDAPHLFVIGAYRGSGGHYVPVFFGEGGGRPYAQPRPDCGLSPGDPQAWEGWSVVDGRVELCGTRWRVRPSPVPAVP